MIELQDPNQSVGRVLRRLQLQEVKTHGRRVTVEAPSWNQLLQLFIYLHRSVVVLNQLKNVSLFRHYNYHVIGDFALFVPAFAAYNFVS